MVCGCRSMSSLFPLLVLFLATLSTTTLAKPLNNKNNQKEEAALPQPTFQQYTHRVFSVLGNTIWRRLASEYGKQRKGEDALNDDDLEELGKIFEQVIAEDKEKGGKVQSELNSIKRQEMDTLRKQIIPRKKHMEESFKDPSHLEINKLKFSVEDIKLLVKANEQHHKEWSQLREKDFKRFEMEKRFQEQEVLRHMGNEVERKAWMEQREKEAAQFNNNKPDLKHPLTKDSNQEVWQDVDNLPKKEYNAKTFFSLHDTDSDGYLSEPEVLTILENELSKKSKNPDDPEERNLREQQIWKMWDHIYKTVDLDKDSLISFEEFVMAENDAKEDKWKDEDEGGVDYEKEELDEYLRERIDQVRDSFAQGEKPENYNYTDVPLLDGNFINETHFMVGDVLMEADNRESWERLQEYKERDMMRKFQQEQALAHAQNEFDRERIRREMINSPHDPELSMPLSRSQIQVVLDIQDHRNESDIADEAFFHLHDINTDGFIDKQELRFLLLSEMAQKQMLKSQKDGKDPKVFDHDEISAEVELMKDHVLNQWDTNKDQKLDMEEFLVAAKEVQGREEALDKKKIGQQNIDRYFHDLEEKSQFTEEEYQKFRKNELGKIRTLIAEGKIPTNYNYTDVPQLAGSFINSTHVQKNGIIIDLHNQANEERYKDFKKFLMKQRYFHEEELHKLVNGTVKDQIIEQYKIGKMRRKQRVAAAKVPLSVTQEKEAWKNEDEMDEKDFSPEKYFHLHDTNQDGHLNREEIIATLLTSLQQMEIEGSEERNAKIADWLRYIYRKDKNDDHFIDLEEFLELSNISEKEEAEMKEEEMNELDYPEEEFEQYKETLDASMKQH